MDNKKIKCWVGGCNRKKYKNYFKCRKHLKDGTKMQVPSTREVPEAGGTPSKF